MEITITSKLKLTDTSQRMVKILASALTILNPKYIESQKMGRYTGKIPQHLKYYGMEPDGSMILPRGFARQLIFLCRKHGEQFSIDDQRRILPEVDFQFQGQLKLFQETAVDDMLKHAFGVLCAATGSGKTVMALALVAERKQPALIIVHTKELLNQWCDRIEAFLGIPKGEIGVIGGGKFSIRDRITVGTYQTISKHLDKLVPYIGNVIQDECHRVCSKSLSEVVSAFDSKYMTGLSATPWRRDELSKLIFWYLGDVHHEVDKAELIDKGHILKAEVITRETEFETSHDPSAEYSKMLSELTEDEERNNLIVLDVAERVSTSKGICLVLSDRKGHCEAIQTALKEDCCIESELLTGSTPTKKRQAIVDRLNNNNGDVKVLIATGQLIGEGFDCKGLSTLFLATPIKFSGRVLQYLGRVLRPAPGKDRAVVFDYVDINVGPLIASARSRQRVYEAA